MTRTEPRTFTGDQPLDTFLIAKREVARRLGLSTRMVDELVRRRKIPFIKLGYRTIRFDWERVKTAVEKLEFKEVGRK